MKNKFKKIGISLMIVGFLLVGAQAGSALPQNPLTKPMAIAGWLYVGGGGPGNYTTIQSAINAASDGDTIYVYAGTYNENINVTVSIRIIGAGRAVTTIQGNNAFPTVKIFRQNILIQGFTIKNDGSQFGIETTTSSSQHQFRDNILTRVSRGINLYYSSDNTITGNLFYDNTLTGVYTDVGMNCTISNNEFYNNTVNGVYLNGSGITYIENNTFRNNGNGIYCFADNNNFFTNNVIEFNSYGIFLSGEFLLNSNHNTISHNRINNNTICGIYMERSQLNRIEFNEIKGNGKGIEASYTAGNIIRNNHISQSDIMEITLSISLGDFIVRNNLEHTQDRLVLVQIYFGFSDASNNWWGSVQWPLRRVRPIGGWVIISPWRMGPFDINVGPEL
jgi:parallel beta-helix repeat protein